MKKLVSTTLVATILAASIPAAFAADTETKGKGHTKAEVKAEAKATTDSETTESSDTQTDDSEDTAIDIAIKDVKLKKQLIDLRQELKHTPDITDEQKAEYEQLVADLEKTSYKHSALEVQLELLQRTYQKGDHAPFKKLGELLEATGEKEIKAFVDGNLVQTDVAPFLQGGRALVPVRAISAALKADVKWDAGSRTVVIIRGEQSITLYLDKKEATVDGKTVALDIAPVLKNGRVFLPLRFISEQLKANVNWQEEGKIVIIDDLQAADEDNKKDESSSSTEDADTDADTETK
ncbi:copper amine oxidase N-terminal domain-containing protein [Brevibacillus choshinensis]|uniref:Copper amine oxidase N-terminal domain-containing protein n=1 Tax=Brevibacillus choshinensis TaxID=54911 RepID=A0ABX7FUL6_BRECH|nr:copper amine oxidase N-terminal domain-containing protein [Brevibacillus choshinensis]QRG69312.1 copper amine oxidase N-terminal domain-containing protein [Brevibacillus choshinensis]